MATPAQAPATPSPQTATDSEILQALLRGLGLPDLKLNRPGPEVAESVGAMLREATAGTIDVLMARALTKKESRIDVTMLAVRSNNPLKFFPNADGALTQMLTNSMAGYLPGLKAMSSAFDDLRAHELAVIAGMRAALGAVLHRFDPVLIENRLAGPTVMDKMLGANRKAKMWDRLVELYGEIAREADDDLQRLFGEKFSEAYEEQVARLRQARKQEAQSPDLKSP
jgi:FHA domain-containing protein/type VI secretion system protein